jgi:hypothetical protein
LQSSSSTCFSWVAQDDHEPFCSSLSCASFFLSCKKQQWTRSSLSSCGFYS